MLKKKNHYVKQWNIYFKKTKQNKKPPRNLQNCALLLVRYVDDDSLSGELFYDTQLWISYHRVQDKLGILNFEHIWISAVASEQFFILKVMHQIALPWLLWPVPYSMPLLAHLNCLHLNSQGERKEKEKVKTLEA